MAELATELERIWLRDLRYSYFEAHVITIGEQRVHRDAVTQIAPDDFYVTASIIAEPPQSANTTAALPRSWRAWADPE